MKRILMLTCLAVSVAAANCRSSQLAFSEDSIKYNGMVSTEGGGAVMQKTTVVGVHLILGLIPIYRANLDAALDQFTKEARRKGMNRLRITHSDRETGIWYFPPITWVITPVFYDITGEVLR